MNNFNVKDAVYDNEHFYVQRCEHEVEAGGATYTQVYAVVGKDDDIPELFHPSRIVCLEMAERWTQDLIQESYRWWRNPAEFFEGESDLEEDLPFDPDPPKEPSTH